MKNKVSVVVTSYRDRGNLSNILDAWDSFDVPVYLADGNPNDNQWDKVYNIHHYRYHPDPGNKIQYATAALTTTPFVLLADDDVMPKPGLIEDFLNYHQYGFSGIMGREFTCDDYRKTPFHRADKLEEPKKVGFVGVLYFIDREFLNFDYSKIPDSSVNDLYWQMFKYRGANKYVIPTKNYENLPECNDAQSIFKTPASRQYREKWYKEKYNEVNK